MLSTKGPVKPLARHLIVDLYNCDRDILDDVDTLRAAMLETTANVGGTRLADAFHKFEPHGVSGTVVIAESHLSIHTWPEHGYAAVDIFTCGELDPRQGIPHLTNALRAGKVRCQELRRGMDLSGTSEARPEDMKITLRNVGETADTDNEEKR